MTYYCVSQCTSLVVYSSKELDGKEQNHHEVFVLWLLSATKLDIGMIFCVRLKVIVKQYSWIRIN